MTPSATPRSSRSLSIVVIAQDEEADIEACIESALFADQVIVVDGGSEDRTVALASSHASVRVIERPWDGYSSQWNYAIDQATGDWVMTLSADEVITPELADELLAAIRKNDVDALRLSFRFVVFGRVLRFGIFNLHRELRCVRKSELLGMSDELVHEHLLARPDARHRDLSGRIIHKTYASHEDYFQKADRYTDLEAIELAAAIEERGMHLIPFSIRALVDALLRSSQGGRNPRERLRQLKNSRPSYVTWLCGPPVRFLVDYVLCLGFLDGRTGLFLARAGAMYTHRRYSKAHALLQAKRSKQSWPT